jgi:hypothetical protein
MELVDMVLLDQVQGVVPALPVGERVVTVVLFEQLASSAAGEQHIDAVAGFVASHTAVSLAMDTMKPV